MLARQGFVEARGPRGTFVTAAPPHVAHYALCIPETPEGRHGARIRFWTALANEAAAMTARTDRRVEVFYGSDAGSASEGYRRLEELVREGRLAGVIAPQRPLALFDEPFMKDSAVVPVAVTGAHPCDEGISQVELDLAAFARRAVEHVAAAGRRRMALLVALGTPGMDRWRAYARRRKIEIRPHWLHGIDPSSPATARSLTRLLVHRDQRTRPDALVIADDNLVEHATGGLVDEGVRVPKDLTVVAHCNYPWPTPSVVPVRRLGYDARRVLEACVECVDAVRSRGAPPRHVKIEPVFEDELAPHPELLTGEPRV